MKAIKLTMLLFISLLVVIVFAAAGCSPDREPDEEVIDLEVTEQMEPPDQEEVKAEKPMLTANYFWPWISHGQIVLSSGEIIDGPSFYESDMGFVAEFTEEYDYSGRLVWLVEKTDVFDLQWATLSFNVDYYEQNEKAFDFYLTFEIDDLEPEPGDKGVQEFAVDLVEEERGFVVAIDNIILGKEQESTFATDPINYVALEIEVKVVDQP